MPHSEVYENIHARPRFCLERDRAGGPEHFPGRSGEANYRG